jgi:stage V sporulation protein AE
MIYLNAFLLGGIICLIFQIPLMFTKFGVFRILGAAFVLGSILTAFGVIGGLAEWGGGGIKVMILSAGEIAFNIGSFAVAGMWAESLTSLVILAIVVLAVLLLGVLGAMLYLITHKQAVNEAREEMGNK